MVDPKQINPDKLNAQESGQTNQPADPPTSDLVDKNNKQPDLTPTPDLDPKKTDPPTVLLTSDPIDEKSGQPDLTPKPSSPAQDLGIKTPDLDSKQPEEIKEAPPGDIKKQLSTLGISPTKGNPAKPANKTAYLLIGLLLLLVSIPAGVYLVNQRQEIRKEAGPRCEADWPDSQKTGGCGDPDCCRSWEVYVDGCCHSTAGCTQDSDCLPGNICSGGTCVGSGTLECHADNTGVRIVNNTDKAISGGVSWFSRWCDDLDYTNCLCGGQPSSESITVNPGETWSRNITGNGPPINCAWQSDIQFSTCHNTNAGCELGCDETPTPTPTGTQTPTPTPTNTLTPTPTTTLTPTPTNTLTPTPTATGTVTPTPTGTKTPTPTNTLTPTPTGTPTPTPTGTLTPTPTPTSGPTPTSTPTITAEVQLPEAGFALPTFQGILTGLLLLIMGALLIL